MSIEFHELPGNPAHELNRCVRPTVAPVSAGALSRAAVEWLKAHADSPDARRMLGIKTFRDLSGFLLDEYKIAIDFNSFDECSAVCEALALRYQSRFDEVAPGLVTVAALTPVDLPGALSLAIGVKSSPHGATVNYQSRRVVTTDGASHEITPQCDGFGIAYLFLKVMGALVSPPGDPCGTHATCSHAHESVEGEAREPIAIEVVESQTCPRRDEGPGYDRLNTDRWRRNRWCKDRAAVERVRDELNKTEYAAYLASHKKHAAHVPNIAPADTFDVFVSRRHFGAYNDLWLWGGNVPRTCSYCGGIHPDDALTLVKAGWELEDTGKGYKYYMHPPGWNAHVKQVFDGYSNERAGVECDKPAPFADPSPPVKLYMQHVSDTQRDAINEAMKERARCDAEERLKQLDAAREAAFKGTGPAAPGA